MKHAPGLHLAEMALAALFGAALTLISPANAQTFGSSYTSTAPKDCRMMGKPSELDGSTTRVWRLVPTPSKSLQHLKHV
jgi:hypothetical protein